MPIVSYSRRYCLIVGILFVRMRRHNSIVRKRGAILDNYFTVTSLFPLFIVAIIIHEALTCIHILLLVFLIVTGTLSLFIRC